MTICHNSHRYSPVFAQLPEDQGGSGRHKCCGCAYEQGFQQGLNRRTQPWVNLDALPESQASYVRHKSPQAAYAMGYRDGVMASYNPSSMVG